MGLIFDAMSRHPDDEPPRDPKQVEPADDATPSPALEAGAPGTPDAAASISAPLGPHDRRPDSRDEPSRRSRHDDDRRSRHSVDDRLVALTEPSSVMSEEYRAIRTGMLARWEHKRHLVHTITSATPQEGKTITSLNLGLSFAELRNRRTLVVEADLRLPQFRKLLSLPDQPGLLSVLENKASLSDAIIEVSQTSLDMITAGGRANNRAVQLLHSNRMIELLQEVRQRYDHVIIDTPPVVELADAGIIGAMSDDVLMIVRMSRTPQPLVEQAIRTLTSYHAPVAGLVATDQTRYRGRYYYKYGYRYRYRYHYTSKQAA
ncbi:MAG: hypothetical protein CMJ18_20675 [Phycisphaeraceae bacterium]|nr:hypothetical protein [Phycisphaeraceae bacterium]